MAYPKTQKEYNPSVVPKTTIFYKLLFAMFSVPAILSRFFSIFFIFSKTPLIIALVIIVQAIIIASCTFTIFYTSWFSFILFIIFIRAIIIIFVYVSSLASNDFFASAVSSFTFAFITTATITILFYLNKPTHNYIQYSQLNLSDIELGATTAYKLYAPYVLFVVIFLIVYLLVALIVVAKNSSRSQGALRALKP